MSPGIHRQQTFLPCRGFTESARALDKRRLGKQRVETTQVLRAFTVPGYSWRHHPAAPMWGGYEEALVRYGLDICAVWCESGNADTCATMLVKDLTRTIGQTVVRTRPELEAAREAPPWLGEPDVYRSHQAALVRKDPEHYRRFFPDIPDELPYVWPASDRTRRVPV